MYIYTLNHIIKKMFGLIFIVHADVFVDDNKYNSSTNIYVYFFANKQCFCEKKNLKLNHIEDGERTDLSISIAQK